MEQLPLIKCDLGIYTATWYGGLMIHIHNRFTGKEINVFTMADKEHTSKDVLAFMRRKLREHIDVLPVVD